MENLVTFYVIWKGDEDNYFVTALDLDPLMMAVGSNRLTTNQVVQMAYDAEYPGEENNPFVGENPASYDMIDIISGDNIIFHMD